MARVKRRNDYQVIEEISKYLVDSKGGIIPLQKLCSDLNINIKTGQKWLKILQIIKTQCPNFRYETTEDKSYIIRPYFEGTENEVQIRLHQLLAKHGIEVSELRKEIVEILAKEITRVEKITPTPKLPEDVMSELKKEIAEVVGEKVKNVVAVDKAKIEARIPPEALKELKQELTEAVTKGARSLRPVKTKKRKAKTHRSEFHAELMEALAKGIDGLEHVDPKTIHPQDRSHVVASIKQELLEVIAKRFDNLEEEE